jgi:hypothetical protein
VVLLETGRRHGLVMLGLDDRGGIRRVQRFIAADVDLGGLVGRVRAKLFLQLRLRVLLLGDRGRPSLLLVRLVHLPLLPQSVRR